MEEQLGIDAAAVTGWIHAFQQDVALNKQLLTDLDSAIGDADHGINMDRGMTAAVAKLDEAPGVDIGAVLKAVGMALISTVGGAAGPLYGTFFMQAGQALTGANDLDTDGWAKALDAGVNGVAKIGKATAGEKTMLDALIPARDAFAAAAAAGGSFASALERSAGAAADGMRATVPMLATKGRASYLGERSIGHQDPGATSAHLLLRAAADTWTTSLGGE